MMRAYDSLKKIYEDAHVFKQIQSLLEWDVRVVMPPGALGEREKMQLTLSNILRAQREQSQIDVLMQEAVMECETLFGWDRRNFDLMEWIRRVQNAIPSVLVARLDTTERECKTLWPVAKRAKDWGMIAPLFTEVVKLNRERAHIISGMLNCTPYEASLHDHTRGVSSADLDAIFAVLRMHLKPLLQRDSIPHNPVAVRLTAEQQLTLCRRLVEKIGFDFTYGRMDISDKGFHRWTDMDSRIGVQPNAENCLLTLYSALHEAGHALHKRYRPSEWLAQPIGTPGDYCLREGMALFWQCYACQQKPFLDLVADELSLLAHEPVSSNDILGALSHSRASTMRIGHGDANYMMHIMMRYELERDLINGKLEVADLPEAWDAAILENLGLEVPDVGQGCLQDIHWYKGSFGYFPCYALGHMYGAQLFAKARQDIADFDTRYLKDNADATVDWLSWHIYSKANSKTGIEVVQDTTGAKLDPRYFIDHVRRQVAGQFDTTP